MQIRGKNGKGVGKYLHGRKASHEPSRWHAPWVSRLLFLRCLVQGTDRDAIYILGRIIRVFLATRRGSQLSSPRRGFLIVPMLLYWIYFNFFYNAQIGIRHVLPVFALGIIFCGRFLAKPESKLRNCAAVVLVSWVAASTLSYYPHFISYFNEFVLHRKLAYRRLADSNLDWRGNEWYWLSISVVIPARS